MELLTLIILTNHSSRKVHNVRIMTKGIMGPNNLINKNRFFHCIFHPILNTSSKTILRMLRNSPKGTLVSIAIKKAMPQASRSPNTIFTILTNRGEKFFHFKIIAMNNFHFSLITFGQIPNFSAIQLNDIDENPRIIEGLYDKNWALYKQN